MAKTNHSGKKKQKQQPKYSKKQKIEKAQIPEHWSFPKLDKFFSKNLNIVFFISLALTIILGVYLFDLKISEGGDDSDYIVAAKHFLTGKSFPTWHGSLYPIFISLLVAISGVNLFVLKMFSFVSIIGHLIIFYYAFRKVISPTFLGFILLILAVNSHLLYYASQTYSEAFYMMLQMVAVFFMFKLLDTNVPDKIKDQMQHWKSWLVLGLFSFFIFQTRNIGVSMLMAIILFFLFEKKYIHAVFSFAGFLIFAIPFKLYKNIVWNLNQANLKGQLELMFYKNPYNQALGKEDFAGMITRVIENSKIYLSRQLMIILGFRPEGSKETNLFLAIVILLLLVVTLILVYKRNKKIFFILIYALIGIGATFVSLHALWGQPRVILIYVPFMLVSFAWLGQYMSKKKSYRYVKLILLALFGFIFLKTLSVTAGKIEDHKKELEENFKGNKYYGFTPDWIHFLAMSEWAGKTLPDSAKIASRKPSMSFIYSNGREFFGIYKFMTLDLEETLQEYNQMYDQLTIVNLNDFVKNKIPMNLQFAYHQQSLAYAYDNNDIYGVFHLQRGRNELTQILNNHNIQYWNDADSLLTFAQNRDFSAASPDTLLYNLKEHSVDYIIRANLRVNPRKKTARTINTVARYIYFIEMKYPGIFEQVNQVGEDDNEPAHLFKINYEKFNIK